MVHHNLFTQTTREALSNPTRKIFITPDREEGLRNKAWTPPGESCLRCSGLLVPSYLASLESDVTGKPMRLWRCVNCGDYLDNDILANRWKGLVPACETADSGAT